MTGDSIIAFNAVLLAALASPGAALLYAIKTSLSAGRKAGILTGMGLGSMAALWTLAALLGLEGLFSIFPWAYATLKFGGAIYLIWLAIQTWRHARTPLGDSPVSDRRAFMGGFVVNFLNPKSVLFAAAVIVVVFPQGLSPRDIALIVANHWLLEVLFYSICAFLLSTPLARQRYLGLKPLFDRIAAAMLGVLGLRLFLEK